jgi:chromosome segregation ATPase
MLYCHTDDVKRLQKVIIDTEQQFVDCLQQIKTLGEEKEQRQKELEQRQKELEDFKGAAQQLVDMVDLQEGSKADGRSLLERLLGAPQKVLSFITEAPITCVSHTISFVKSF